MDELQAETMLDWYAWGMFGRPYDQLTDTEVNAVFDAYDEDEPEQ